MVGFNLNPTVRQLKKDAKRTENKYLNILMELRELDLEKPEFYYVGNIKVNIKEEYKRKLEVDIEKIKEEYHKAKVALSHALAMGKTC